jgi:nicotinamide mononucleotide adenylyltransferase
MREVVFGVGRCNPPTDGHRFVIQRIEHIAQELGVQAEFHIVDGEQSGQDKSKNPLSPEQRVAILKRWFPYVHFEIVNSAMDSMDILEVQAKRPVAMIAGSDRAKKYKRLLDYAGFTQAYIVTINRDAGSVGGVSGTKARTAAAQNNFEEFRNMLPSINTIEAREIFELVRKAIQGNGDG